MGTFFLIVIKIENFICYWLLILLSLLSKNIMIYLILIYSNVFKKPVRISDMSKLNLRYLYYIIILYLNNNYAFERSSYKVYILSAFFQMYQISN